MKDFNTIDYHPTAEKIVDIICEKTGTEDRTFFRVMIAYYFAKMASSMRVNILSHDRGVIPINLYAINLATSGQGKGHSTNIVEDKIIHKFRQKFMESTFPLLSGQNLDKLSADRAAKNNTDLDVEKITTNAEFNAAGTFVFSFDSGTSAAVKQMRHKLLLSGIGSMNMEIDEIGSNLLSNIDVLKVFFELFDIGKVKQKLTKNTNDNARSEELHGNTPTNMMLFGTPTKLFDGGKTEDEMVSMLETGMARRCFFGVNEETKINTSLTPEQVYAKMTNSNSSAYLIKIAEKFEKLASVVNFGINLGMSKEVSLLLIEYKIYCEKLVNTLPSHKSIQKAEIAHRYFKVAKLAGAYAFVDEASEVKEEHVYAAIKLAEDSGKAFTKLMTRDKNYVKLAKYLADVNKEVTHADLAEDLPFYKGAESTKRDMMSLASAWGYKNNIVITSNYTDGIEFLKGETLKQVDLDNLALAYSNDIAYNYVNASVKFSDLHKLTNLPNYHWVAHHLTDGHRCEDSIVPGFDLIVIDVDDGTSIDTIKLLMQEYTYMLYTTKRHTQDHNRFRLIFPMSHRLEMSKSDYTKFMQNVYEWLPFNVDTSTIDRSRKWLTHNQHFEYNDGEQINSLLFIPKTAKNDEYKKFITDNQSLSNIERWFIRNTGVGNRSNQLIKYALLLVDSGFKLNDIQDKLLILNGKLKDGLSHEELLTTILTSATRAIIKRDAGS